MLRWRSSRPRRPPRPPADEVRHCQSEIASLNRRLDRASESLCKATYAIKVLHFKLQHERRTVGALQADKCCLQARLLQVGGRCPDYGAPEEGAPVAANAYEAGMAELARRLAAAEDAAATADALREELSRARGGRGGGAARAGGRGARGGDRGRGRAPGRRADGRA
ncbi:hypothetical protein QBZ16_004800 [Prototheca wickerhamii]|uniref:Uncharacterized protein n=1 Tax=Prototheca wickerhamii TaxID=3111 RepID=A0AAD9IF07_PROWI|nr:hypothetical protein QBZ16_004800 [Prototheca wickerhamii]